MSFVVIGTYAGGQSYVVYGPDTKERARLALQWNRHYYPKVYFTLAKKVTK